MRPWFTLGAAALIAAGAGYWAWQAGQPAATEPAVSPATIAADTAAPDSAATASRLLELSYPDLDGNTRTTREWDDKVLVLNFWATWCPPCREETPLFVELQDEYAARGVQFVGLAIDDRQAVLDFADSYGVEYPVLLGDIDAMAISKQLGNRFQGLPFTLIVAPGGQIEVRHFGGIEREQIVPVLDRLTSGAG